MIIKNWTFRRAKRKDFGSIAEFQNAFPRISKYESVPERDFDTEFYLWLHRRNPIMQGEIWIAENCGRVVGMRSAIPKRLKIFEKIMIGAEMGDSYTQPEYRGQGMFSVLSKEVRKEVLNNGVRFIYNTPNPKTSLPLHKRKLNHREIPSLGVCSMMRPLNIKRTLKVKLGSSLLASFPSAILEIAYRIILNLTAIEARKKDILVSEVSSFPDDIVDLWTRVSTSYDVILVREKKYLEWRFVMAPDEYLILIARSREGRLLGYIVGKVNIYSRPLRRGLIADFLTIEDNPKVFKELVHELLEKFRLYKVDDVSTLAVKGGIYYKALIRLGFLPTRKVPVLCYKNDLGNEIINGDHKWHFTLSDTDSV